jgi:poly-gamma-glutamate synthesis protein (capsule biosynthesis protein)
MRKCILSLASAFFIIMLIIPAGPMAEDGPDAEGTVLVFMGDLAFNSMIDDRIVSQGREYPFEKMMKHIHDADLAFANLETPISERGHEEEGKYCTFRTGDEVVDSMVYADIDAVSLANNHCLDYGPDALNDTVSHLNGAGIEHAGLWYGNEVKNSKIPRPVIIDSDGLRFGFLAYTEDVRDHWMATDTRAGPMPLDRGLMEDDIEYASDRVDVLIVSIHWRKWPQYTEGPEPSDRELCRDVVDWGADIVMGHGPHTVHEVEGYGDGLILYSLGNAAMVTGNDTSDHSYIARVELAGSKLRSLELVPTYQETYRYVPMGAPITRSVEEGLNVTYEEVWGMYRNDIYDVVDDERDREWLIMVEELPWYAKSLLVVLLVTLITAVLLLGAAGIKRKGGVRGK